MPGTRKIQNPASTHYQKYNDKNHYQIAKRVSAPCQEAGNRLDSQNVSLAQTAGCMVVYNGFFDDRLYFFVGYFWHGYLSLFDPYGLAH
jgi:hypothetical protein